MCVCNACVCGGGTFMTSSQVGGVAGFRVSLEQHGALKGVEHQGRVGTGAVQGWRGRAGWHRGAAG